MGLQSYAWALFCAAAFVLWPVIGKYSGLSGTWINTLALSFSTLSGILLSLPSLAKEPIPSFKAVAVMAAAGLINGAAVYAYSMQTSNPLVPTGRFIAVATLMMVVLGPLFACLINEAITVRQCAGLLMAGAAIYLIAG